MTVLRTMVNRPGITYDEAKTSVIFAEDMNLIKTNLDRLSGGTNFLELINVAADGKTGLGVATPLSKLHVQNKVDIYENLVLLRGISWNGSAWVPGQAVFYVGNQSAGYKVGIGTESPNTKLDVRGTDDAQVTIVGPNNAPGETAGIDFRYHNGADTTKIARILAVVGSGGGGDIDFQTASSGSGTYTTKFRVKRGGGLNAGSLPTSASGLSAGDIWNDGGTLKIV